MEKQFKGVLFRIVFAIMGAISGISILAAFIALKNINAAIWGLLSAIFALTCLRLLVAYRRNVLIERFPLPSLRRLKHFGAFASVATLVAAITYFILAGVLHQGYQVKNDGYMPAGVFALLTLKWTLFLFFYCKRFEKMYADRESQPIANGNSDRNLKNTIE